jgi:hypothetical protein
MWVCSVCGSSDVQGLAWCNLNGDPKHQEWEDTRRGNQCYFCPLCGDYVEIREAETVEQLAHALELLMDLEGGEPRNDPASRSVWETCGDALARARKHAKKQTSGV